MYRYITHIALLISFTLLPALLSAQPATNGQDADLALYWGWLEAESKDSAYFKAYHLFQASNGANKINTDVQGVLGKSYRTKSRQETVRELDTLYMAFTEAFRKNKDYGKAFYIGFQLEEKLSFVTESEFPDKRKIYYKLGEAYYLFLDFHKSIALLEKALSPVPLSFDDTANLDALKIIGICYANIGKMELSDNYFRATLRSDDLVLQRPLYNAYAVSHLGCNEMIKGNYDNALQLSSAVWPTLRETNDYGHLAGMCYCRGRSYLQKGEYKQASQWIDSLVHFAHQDQYNYTKRIKQAYLLQADYYSALGDARQTKVYGDSLVSAYKSGELEYTSQYITYAVHKYNGEKIEAQGNKIRVVQNSIVIISVIALLGIAAALIIWSLYRKKNAAYTALAARAIEWAREGKEEVPRHFDAGGNSITNGTPSENVVSGIKIENNTVSGIGNTGSPTDEDCRIMSLVECEMTERYVYRDPDLTGESLADRLDIHRNNLSRTVNRITGNNFNHYINSYRIREAVRIISETDRKQLYIDELYERVGFGSRASFYRAFKQFTGLSPIDFQKNKDSSLRGSEFCD